MEPSKKNMAFCPECGHSVKLGSRPKEGQKVSCARCKLSLEVASVDPLELDLSVAAAGKGGKKPIKPKRPKSKEDWFDSQNEFQESWSDFA